MRWRNGSHYGDEKIKEKEMRYSGLRLDSRARIFNSARNSMLEKVSSIERSREIVVFGKTHATDNVTSNDAKRLATFAGSFSVGIRITYLLRSLACLRSGKARTRARIANRAYDLALTLQFLFHNTVISRDTLCFYARITARVN